MMGTEEYFRSRVIGLGESFRSAHWTVRNSPINLGGGTRLPLIFGLMGGHRITHSPAYNQYTSPVPSSREYKFPKRGLLWV